MKRSILLFLCIFSFLAALSAANGHNIKVKLDNYASKKLILGFYYGDKPYVKDTFDIGPDGYFTFKADTMLPCGVYLLVLIPENSFIQFAVPEDDQVFTINTDAKESVSKMKVQGSVDNQVFYDYLQYLNKARPEADTLRAQLERLKKVPSDSVRIATQLGDMDKRVKQYQQEILKKYPATISAKIVRASIEPEPPEFPGDEKTTFPLRREWVRKHYFDNLDITDVCLLRSPVLHPRIEQFVNKFTVQHPDSIIQSVDQVLMLTKKSDDVFKYYLIHFLNVYAKSTLVGMDAVYVHIAKDYYCKGLAPWTKKEDLEKICDNANRLEPILIGKIAPNIVVKDRNNNPAALWDVDADYTVLFFWDPECGHCKKSAPFMVDFAKKFQDRGVKIFAVCTAVGDKGPDCWKSAEEKGFSDFLFLNYSDPYIQSRYKTLYDVRTTPQIFILNRNHKILMKRIGAEQLGEVMEQVMRFEEESKKQNK